MRANLRQILNRNGPAGVWVRIVLLCSLVVIGGVLDFQHHALARDASIAAQTMQAVETAQSMEGHGDTRTRGGVSCHAVGACAYLSERAPALPAPVTEGGERQIEPALLKTSQSLGGPFRPPRLPVNA